ncbi:NYN domain-containing protein [Peristeroidobacter agariperforans]|uniref:NYN domain-containing protein n=1 Tax=Peristeroidobacter agariperforans TaxID=268404 RepID=UPI00101C7F8E|nr:NYN domain-containing protein [Peristeroidobacter agariperforans]
MQIALLIDCESASPDSIDGILGELAAKGIINIRRGYGNWKNQPGWEAKLHPFAIQPIQQFAYTKGKNALDMCMTVDAMDLLYTEKVDCFALVTSDSDFTPLVLKLLSKGKTVIGFGERKTPAPFVRACSEFIHTDSFKEPSPEHPLPSMMARRTKNELRGDTELMNVLRAAVEGMKDENGFAPMGRIGQYISNHSSLSSKNYGYARWSDLIRATEYFEESPGENRQPRFRRPEN